LKSEFKSVIFKLSSITSFTEKQTTYSNLIVRVFLFLHRRFTIIQSYVLIEVRPPTTRIYRHAIFAPVTLTLTHPDDLT